MLKVLKFGGTSVGSVEQMEQVRQIVNEASQTHRVIVVTSAAAGVTDRLARAFDEIEQDRMQVDALAAWLWRRYHVLAAGVLKPRALERYEDVLLSVLKTLGQPWSRFGSTPARRDHVMAVGERLSAPLVALVLQGAGVDAWSHDAAAFIRTDATHGNALVKRHVTEKHIRAWYAPLSDTMVPVVTGFIGATDAEATTTLGRGGSDYTAALLAASLRASVLERWTDVPGLYSDDPRNRDDARLLPRIRLEEAWAWNQVGRLGMHRKALDPLVAVEIPVHVRCTTSPPMPGTWILPAGFEIPLAALAS